MKETISKNEKSLKVLSEMISRGFYEGIIEEKRFELKRNHFPINHVVIGILNNNNKFILKSDFQPIMRLLFKVFSSLVLILLIILVIKSNWAIALVLSLFFSFFYILNVVNTKKELKLFSNKYFELYRLIHNA